MESRTTNGDDVEMDFMKIDWADSDLERINLEYDRATLIIRNDALQKRLSVVCSGFAGMTNLCIWDDTIILSAGIHPVCNTDNDFLRNLYTAYSKTGDYGGRSLSDGLLELRIMLANQISFSVYCQSIEVAECNS